MDDDSFWSDEDDDELLAAWAEVDRRAADLLRRACADVLEEAPPQPDLAEEAGSLRREIEASAWSVRYFDVACGWAGTPPDDDAETWLPALASTISPPEDPGISAEEQAAVFSLQHADWVGVVVGLVRRGVGAEFAAETWSEDIAAMPEVDDETEDPDDDVDSFVIPVEVLAPLWQTLGVLDEERCLTPLGRWGLPRALLSAWGAAAPASPDLLDEEQAAVALDILSSGPISVDDMRAALARREVFADIDKINRSLLWRTEVYALEDGRLVPFLVLLEGAVLTHRVRAEEIESGVLDPVQDLAPFDYLAMDDVPLRGGGHVQSMHAGQRGADGLAGLHGPSGWLDGLVSGDTIGLRYVDGELAWEPAPTHDDPEARAFLQATAWRCARQAAAEHRDYPGVGITEVVLLALIERPGLFDRPLPPLSDLLEEAGLELDGSDVGVPGTSWHGEPDWLTDAQRVAYRAWRDALAAHRNGELPGAAELVALSEGLEGVVGDLAAYELAAEPDREPLVVAMQEAVTGKAQAVPLYLRARVAEVRGDVLAMSSLLEACLAADPDAPDAAAELAELRAVAGNAAEAQRLFTLGGLERDAIEVRALRPFLSPPAGDTGRNQPCPCGSGRKYKLCHGRTALHPMPDRAAWLLVKVVGYLQRGHNRERLLHWAGLMSGEDRSSRETVTLAMHDATTWDFALFDGGILEDFVALYRPLLPPDEAQLAESSAGHRSAPARSHRCDPDARADVSRPGNRREPGAAGPNAESFGAVQGPPARTSARLRRGSSAVLERPGRHPAVAAPSAPGPAAFGSRARGDRGLFRSRQPHTGPPDDRGRGTGDVHGAVRGPRPGRGMARTEPEARRRRRGPAPCRRRARQPDTGAGYRTPRRRSDRLGDDGTRAATRAAGARARDRP